MTESDDDVPQLCQSTLDALQAFYTERQERENQMTKILNNQYNNETSDAPEIKFEEDWVRW